MDSSAMVVHIKDLLSQLAEEEFKNVIPEEDKEAWGRCMLR